MLRILEDPDPLCCSFNILYSNDFLPINICLVFCVEVKSKIDMVDSLLEIELAYNLLSEGDKSDKVLMVNFDKYYEGKY